jgi:chromosome segregation ATPase
MAEPLQDNSPRDVQVDDTTPDISSRGSHTPPEPETESKRENYPDPEAQNMVIESLRSQIQDLFSQVTQLNGKLVTSYDRVSHLEDQLHDSSNGLRSASVTISQLELERSQHLSALNSGLLVERTHVTAELTRLMEKATEEAARRGEAESARTQIEKELDDLSAGLFGQANTMVAEARLGRAASERKVEETERALKGTEEAIANMQLHMQALHEEKEEALRQVEEMQVTVGKGKWSRRDASTLVTLPRHILSCTSQYQDFLSFVAHIRELQQKSSILPPITTVNHPWLARLQLEDS